MRETTTFPKILIGLKSLLRQAVPLALLALITATSFAIAIFPETKDLIKKLKSSDPDMRRAAAKELGELGPDAADAVPALAAALKDSDKFVRRFAAQSLAKMGDAAKPAREPLAAILKNPAEVREVLAEHNLAERQAVGLGGGGGVPATLVPILAAQAVSFGRRPDRRPGGGGGVRVERASRTGGGVSGEGDGVEGGVHLRLSFVFSESLRPR